MVVEEVKALYRVAPDDFVAERTLLVRQLKKDKRKEDAAAIAKLRRPKAAEYLLNRLSREDPDVVAEWATAVGSARDAQSAAIGGASGADLRAATAAVNAAAKATVDAAHGLDAAIKRDDLVSVLRTLIAADSTGMLTSGVVGSEGVLAPADLFAGAPEPAERIARERPVPVARARPKAQKPTDDAGHPAAVAGHPAPDEPTPQHEPTPEPVRRPSATEIRRRTKLIADYQRIQATLQAARASVSAAEARLAAARDALAKAEATTAQRRAELDEAVATAGRLTAEVAALDPPA